MFSRPSQGMGGAGLILNAVVLKCPFSVQSVWAETGGDWPDFRDSGYLQRGAQVAR